MKISRLQILTWDGATDKHGSPRSHILQVKELLDAGADWIQLRQKNGTDEQKIKVAIEAVKLCKAYNATIIINDCPKICLESGADGVHLGLSDCSVAQAREIIGSRDREIPPISTEGVLNGGRRGGSVKMPPSRGGGMQKVPPISTEGVLNGGRRGGSVKMPPSRGGIIIGGTCNTQLQVSQRVTENCDYIGLGPYRFTGTKNNLNPTLGESGVKKITDLHPPTPIIVIGGISPSDYPTLKSLGVWGVAVSSAIVGAANIKEAYKEFVM
ncbi:hypothetical protein AGMMS49938_14350 [Fibrobacterales bacterium]|nr:hypothetical protein AGMMS49938_14350 [Fibrobacterales bacterium]